jgi:hypothetical protein
LTDGQHDDGVAAARRDTHSNHVRVLRGMSPRASASSCGSIRIIGRKLLPRVAAVGCAGVAW